MPRGSAAIRAITPFPTRSWAWAQGTRARLTASRDWRGSSSGYHDWLEQTEASLPVAREGSAHGLSSSIGPRASGYQIAGYYTADFTIDFEAGAARPARERSAAAHAMAAH